MHDKDEAMIRSTVIALVSPAETQVRRKYVEKVVRSLVAAVRRDCECRRDINVQV